MKEIKISKKLIQLTKNQTKEYFFKNNKRFVVPYFIEFTTGCRNRWFNRKVFEIYRSEFPYFTEQYLEEAFLNNRFKINGKIINNKEIIIKENDTITHIVHFHEKPILNEPIEIIYEDDNLLVVNKPFSIPVHPCGRYSKNSLTTILEEEGYKKLKPINRLDHSTSGVLVLVKEKQLAKKLIELIKTREDSIKKYYLTIVSGKFEDFTTTIKEEEDTIYFNTDNKIKSCNKKVVCVDHKKGMWEANDEIGVLEAKTYFYGIAYNKEKNISLVLVKPITGRTHQIRIHLKALGFPIINDFLYNQEFIENNFNRKEEDDNREDDKELVVQKEEELKKKEEELLVEMKNTSSLIIENSNSKQKHQPSTRKAIKTNDVLAYDSICVNCSLESNLQEHDNIPLFIYLHAYRYELTNEYTFQTDIPKWVDEYFPDETTSSSSIVELRGERIRNKILSGVEILSECGKADEE
ncbi:hypothetical protein ABK040_003695 [Willaertia magna]